MFFMEQQSQIQYNYDKDLRVFKIYRLQDLFVNEA